MGASVADEAVQRAKYLDWCSARLADHFLRLTPAEIYELAQEAADVPETVDPAWTTATRWVVGGEALPELTAALSAGAGSAKVGAAPDSYRALVERVTSALAARLAIPSFEDWLESYRADPARFDEELLGFWKELAPRP